MSTSRVANLRPSRELVVIFMNPIADSHQKTSSRGDAAAGGGDSLAHGEVTFIVEASSAAIWKPGVASSDDKRVSVGQLSRVSIVGAVDLSDSLVPSRQSRLRRNLERTGCDDDLVRRESLIRSRYDVCPGMLGE